MVPNRLGTGTSRCLRFGRGVASAGTAGPRLLDCANQHEETVILREQAKKAPRPDCASECQQRALVALTGSGCQKVAMREYDTDVDTGEAFKESAAFTQRVSLGTGAFE